MPNEALDDGTARWRLADFLDFDYAVEKAAAAGPESDSTHRKVFLAFLAARKRETSDSLDRRRVFRFWLEAQRRQAPPSAIWPGALFCRGKTLLTHALLLIAVFAGALASAGLLRYDGIQPVNVFGFLFFLLGGQLLLLAASFAALILRPLGLLGLETGIIAPGMYHLLKQIAAGTQKASLRGSSSETRLQITSFFGSLGKKHSRYRPLLAGLVAGLSQTFGVWFNLAAIASTLLLVSFSDRAFGWQSSLNLSSENVHRATRVIARPWSSFYPAGAPSVSQIEGSRIYLKDGIRSLSNKNLVSWWPFLVCSLLVYGLLPRLLLWLAAWGIARRQLGKLGFDSLRCDRLWESMIRRQLQVGAAEESPLAFAANSSFPQAPFKKQPTALCSANRQSALLFAEPELAKRVRREAVNEWIHRQIHWAVRRWVPLPDENESWEDFWAALDPMRFQDAYARIVVLQESFQPPIREFLDWLKRLKGTQDADGKAIVLLVGRPKGAEQIGTVSEINRQIWERSVESLGDANLAVDSLAIRNNDGQ